jgi:hypothetical protein
MKNVGTVLEDMQEDKGFGSFPGPDSPAETLAAWLTKLQHGQFTAENVEMLGKDQHALITCPGTPPSPLAVGG